VRRASLLILFVVVFAAGCGGAKPKPVTKTVYETRIDAIGTSLYTAANGLGESTAIQTFNDNVQKIQDALDDGAHELHLMLPPGAKAQAANDRLVDAYHGLEDEFDKVKDARRESYPKAIAALVAVQHSAAAKDSLRAAADLRKLGFEVPVSATIGS
jgi:hypothetical protein